MADHITKDTTIILYKDIPLDPDYKHVIFGTIVPTVAQTIGTFGANSYQRIRKNTLRISSSIDSLTGCNYMKFINNGFEGRNYYAFVTKVNYINNNTTEIEYEIDPMQTYHGEYTCSGFIEREHAVNDDFGKNLVPENIHIGDLLVQNEITVDLTTNGWKYVILYVPQKEGNSVIEISGGSVTARPPTDGDFCSGIAGMFVGAKALEIGIYGSDTPFYTISKAIRLMVEAGDNIVGMYSVPLGTPTTSTYTRGNSFKYAQRVSGYEPRNKKLLLYPFREICVTNNNGNMNKFKWEYTEDGNTFDFQINLYDFPLPEACFIPENYRGVSGIDFANALFITDFPNCAWSEDSFTRWWSQNKLSVAVNGFSNVQALTSSIGQAIANGYMGNYGGMTSAINSGNQAVLNLATMGAQLYGRTRTPDSFSGLSSASISRIKHNKYGFTIYDMAISGEQAEYIDYYFDMYGYAQNIIGQPRVAKGNGSSLGRQYWCYIKMQNCLVEPLSAGMSAEDSRKIEQIFNNGTTFWASQNVVGNYNLNNLPLE